MTLSNLTLMLSLSPFLPSPWGRIHSVLKTLQMTPRVPVQTEMKSLINLTPQSIKFTHVMFVISSVYQKIILRECYKAHLVVCFRKFKSHYELFEDHIGLMLLQYHDMSLPFSFLLYLVQQFNITSHLPKNTKGSVVPHVPRL